MNNKRPHQIISFEGNYNEDVDEYINEVSADGFNYNVCSILGCQSSGKSTLLNHLFGTQFEVMDSIMGRSQTTKGLWASTDWKANEGENPLLVIDVEGTDSKERGEDRVSFEHRASLFALALSDLVVMNMWYTDLGRYTASNYGLLRTVLQVNLELFGKASLEQKNLPTHLVFVIRDYSPMLTPLERLQDMLYTDVRNIWNEIEKPPGLENSKVTEFFTLACVGLPSRVMAIEEFNKQATELKTKMKTEWMDATYSKKIPFDGFTNYSRTIWSSIMDSSELDIPSQKAMLATFRCDELKADAVRQAKVALEHIEQDYQNDLLVHPFSELTTQLNTLFDEALTNYDSHGYRYEGNIFEDIRADLITQLRDATQATLSNRVNPIIKADLERYEMELNDVLNSSKEEIGKDGLPNHELAKNMSEILEHWVLDTNELISSTFGTMAATIPAICSSLGDRAERSSKKYPAWRDSAQFKFDLSSILEGVQEKQTVKASQEFNAIRSWYYHELNNHFLKTVWPENGIDELLMNKNICGKEFWVKLNAQLTKVGAAYSSILGPSFIALTGSKFARPSSDPTTVSGFLSLSLREYLMSCVSQSDRLTRIITDRFDGSFYDDDEGVPRNWQAITFDDIGNVYKGSRDSAFLILDDLCKDNLVYVVDEDMPQLESKLEESGAEKWSTPLIDTGLKGRITDRASRHMKRAVTDAQTVNSTGSGPGLPPWPYWAAVALLGYNEFIAILSSPLTMMFILGVVILVGSAYMSGNIGSIQTMLTSLTAFVATVVLPLIQSLAANNNTRGDAQPRP